jgi:hypothetical protein
MWVLQPFVAFESNLNPTTPNADNHLIFNENPEKEDVSPHPA